jgi:hypothetical protein
MRSVSAKTWISFSKTALKYLIHRDFSGLVLARRLEQSAHDGCSTTTPILDNIQKNTSSIRQSLTVFSASKNGMTEVMTGIPDSIRFRKSSLCHIHSSCFKMSTQMNESSTTSSYFFKGSLNGSSNKKRELSKQEKAIGSRRTDGGMTHGRINLYYQGRLQGTFPDRD